jgi:DNA repair protein RadA/Sms
VSKGTKVREVFICRGCSSEHARWLGKCPDCGAWDSLESRRIDPAASRDTPLGIVEAWSAIQADDSPTPSPGAQRASDATDPGDQRRLATGIGELDRVLGGGLVVGSASLVGGAPGIGKSTLLLQVARSLAHADPASPSVRTLYVSSEESVSQVKMRLGRVAAGPLPDELYLLSDTNLSRIVEQIRRVKPAVVVIDSIQMIYKSDLPAPPGSMTQLRRCCADLVTLAKLSGIAIIMVGHVTKDGQLAGPRLLEHLVDAVVWFEGDRYHAHRVIRGVKNRFGTTLEIGLFEMTSDGLVPAPHPAAVEAAQAATPGSIVCPVIHGSRCVLIEVQALTATGFLGAAKRKCSGLDANRLAMLIAILEQHAGMRLADRDIFASSVGGLRVHEPAADLALLMAIAGAQLRRSLAPATAVVGEVGLGGEIRPVASLESRLMEASRLGFRRAIVPAAPASVRKLDTQRPKTLSLVHVSKISQALEELG